MQRRALATRIALDSQMLLVPLIEFFWVLRLEEDSADSSYSFIVTLRLLYKLNW
jgi:hypothetical protein